MKNLSWLAIALALCAWMVASSRTALAHPGTECAVFDCGEDHGDDDAEGRVLDCGEDHGDDDAEGAVFDCEDEEESGRAVLDCGEDHEESDEG